MVLRALSEDVSAKLIDRCFQDSPVKNEEVKITDVGVSSQKPLLKCSKSQISLGFCYISPLGKGGLIIYSANCNSNFMIPSLVSCHFRKQASLDRSFQRNTRQLLFIYLFPGNLFENNFLRYGFLHCPHQLIVYMTP
jgi:hypothetical protein